MVRVDVLAYTPTDFVEEKDATIGRCRDLIEKFSVTWVNIVDLDERTQEELQALFGLHHLAVEDAQNENLSARVEVYDETVFIVARRSSGLRKSIRIGSRCSLGRSSWSPSTTKPFRNSRTCGSASGRGIPRW